MTDLNKQELRRLAESASPAYEWYAPCDLRYADDKTGEVHGLNHDDDSFISAANPAAILSLLDEIDQLRAEVGALRFDNSSLRGSCKSLGDELKFVRRQCSKFEKGVRWFVNGGAFHRARYPQWMEKLVTGLRGMSALTKKESCGGPSCCQLCADEKAGEVGNG